MMCNEVKLELEAYVQNQLPQIKAEKIRRHLTGCPSCTHHYHDLKEKVAWLVRQREQAPAPMPDYLEQALRSRRPPRPVKAKNRWLPLISLAASFVLILFSLTLLGGNIPLEQGNWVREGARWTMPIRGDNGLSPPFVDNGDSSAKRPETPGGKGGEDNFPWRVQAAVTLERGNNVPYQLRYQVTIEARDFTTATLIVLNEQLSPFSATVQGHFNWQVTHLTLVLPIDDETLPVTESNYLLKNRTLKEFFEAVYLLLHSETDTLEYKIPAENIYFTNNAN